MRIVIQCAGSKKPTAGQMLAPDGRRVRFVARPDLAPAHAGYLYARPDDVVYGGTWRDRVLSYNGLQGENPLGLLPACELYENDVYGALVRHFGAANVFILSAGWGLLTSQFLTPDYDITFSSSAAPHVKRSKNDTYADMKLLDLQSEEPIHFLGGKDYLSLFVNLTQPTKAQRTVHYNSSVKPELRGCATRRFVTRTRTNWHYECAKAIMTGSIDLEADNGTTAQAASTTV